MKIQKVNQIDVYDFDKLVSETYNKKYSFQQQDGCKDRGIECITVPLEHPWDFENTQIPFKVNGEKMGVSFETWLNTSMEDTSKHFPEYKWYNELFWERNFYPHVDMIINDLYEKGLIEEGEYQILIDW